ncbi:AbrB/MazE/SpoVT family DNA-binding domain-containing protein [Desulfonatronum parangueonense]
MLTKVQKWGNSQGLRLPKNVLDDVQINVGDEVDVSVKDNVIVISPVRSIRGKYRIEDLVSQIPEDSKPQETFWGEPVGKETW